MSSTAPSKDTTASADHVFAFTGPNTDLTAIAGGYPKHEPMIELQNTTGAAITVALVSRDKSRAIPAVSAGEAGNTFSVTVAANSTLTIRIPVKSHTAAAGIRTIAYWYNGGTNAYNA